MVWTSLRRVAWCTMLHAAAAALATAAITDIAAAQRAVPSSRAEIAQSFAPVVRRLDRVVTAGQDTTATAQYDFLVVYD